MTVATFPLDLFTFPNPVSVVKMDVEGAEEQVLIGGTQFFETHKPMLFIEIWGSKKEAVSALLEKMNYELFEHIGGEDYIYKHRLV